ncbi:hypothetical protein F0562_031964 [Nyssa sinensis]|uniref:Uncharacterized protein n=1 Tax=Nyssa sinensis TaxID=561372 RepID=A0A5J5AYB4_9ASTE|nr:hypothetical protein F0562_031964 [Nyssa sinensis]
MIKREKGRSGEAEVGYPQPPWLRSTLATSAPGRSATVWAYQRVIPTSFRILSSNLRIKSSGVSIVALTVQLAALAVWAIVDRDNDTSHDQMHWAAFDKLEGKGGSKGDFVVGAPLSDEEQLDFSIAIACEVPPVLYEVPMVDRLGSDAIFIRSSSIVQSQNVVGLSRSLR